MKLPNAERAVVNIAKLRDYSLNPRHEEGKHKARVFAAALGLGMQDANWLRERLLTVARRDDCQLGRKTAHGQRYVMDSPRQPSGQDRKAAERLDRASRRGFPSFGDLLRAIKLSCRRRRLSCWMWLR